MKALFRLRPAFFRFDEPRPTWRGLILRSCVLLALAGPELRAADKKAAPPLLQFRTERAGFASLNLYRSDGVLVRRLVQSQRSAAGVQKVAWDGRDDGGMPVEPGEYTWKGLIHEGIGLKLRGWVGNGSTPPWPTPGENGDWGGDTGVPSAVAADDQRVYLGWSEADQGKAILACDLEGRVRWSHRRVEGPSGCKALAVDDGLLYVLGGLKGVNADGGTIYRLNVKDGAVSAWPDGKADLTISNFWPTEAKAKPAKADAMAVRHGHIYLTFTQSEFIAVLDAKTGAYLQTVVGAPPGQIDVAATKTDLPDAPDKLVDADFAVISLAGGVLGKVLFAHDPLWVVTSELSPVERDARITALTVIGDGAKVHRHDAFIGLGRPFYQIQARPLLDTENVTWVAGKPGGRKATGPWEPNALRDIRALALAADGKLWVAEGDAYPKRFSVWDTKGPQGQLVHEFFGPAGAGAGNGAINPLDPDVMCVQGCEWRIDRKTGRANCLGVVARGAVEARYAVGENGNAYVAVSGEGGVEILERLGDGDCKLRASVYSTQTDRLSGVPYRQPRTFAWADENGDGEMQAEEQKSIDEDLRVGVNAVSQDLTLSTSTLRGEGRIFKVRGWSPCGAPRYELSQPLAQPQQAWLSADGRMAVSQEMPPDAATTGRLLCRDFADGRERWSIAVPPDASLDPGTALLPAPLGNVWLISGGRSSDGSSVNPAGMQLVNEDGFVIARFFAGDPKNVRWPKTAAPGADMSNVSTSNQTSRVTQAADGKLYLQAGDSACWNLEVTGLEKVRPLAGGKVIVPATK